MPHYSTFNDLMQSSILPLHKAHPDWEQLDGQESGGNRSIFATFRYNYHPWKIHADTRIDKLLEAWQIAEAGEKPFQIAKTEQGTLCLHLAGQVENEANGLYIYLQKE